MVRPDGFASAVAAPQSAWVYGGEEDLFVLAALYAYRIAKAHAFADGNKRCGLIAAGMFLLINGINVEIPEATGPEALAALAADELDVAGFAALLRGWAA